MQTTNSHDHHDHDHSHASPLQDDLKTAILIGLSVYFAYVLVSGRLTYYIAASFEWLLYMGAALFLLLGLASAYRLLSVHGLVKHKNDVHNHAHDHSHGAPSWGVLAVVALPLILGTLIPARALGSDAVGTINTQLGANTTLTNTVFNIDPLNRNVLDWLRVFGAVDDYAELSGQPADLIGFVYREPSFGANEFMVARFTISCCVADSSALGVPAVYDGAADIATDRWVRVLGTFEVRPFRDDEVPVLMVTSLETVEQPEHPYLYP